MEKRALSRAGYWRNSLADASLGQGAFHGRDVDQFQKLNASAFEQGVADSVLVEKFFKDIDEVY